jgi:hypothetical protein
MTTSADENVIFATRFSKKLFAKPTLIALTVVAIAVVFKNIDWEYSNHAFWWLLILAVLGCSHAGNRKTGRKTHGEGSSLVRVASWQGV